MSKPRKCSSISFVQLYQETVRYVTLAWLSTRTSQICHSFAHSTHEASGSHPNRASFIRFILVSNRQRYAVEVVTFRPQQILFSLALLEPCETMLNALYFKVRIDIRGSIGDLFFSFNRSIRFRFPFRSRVLVSV